MHWPAVEVIVNKVVIQVQAVTDLAKINAHRVFQKSSHRPVKSHYRPADQEKTED